MEEKIIYSMGMQSKHGVDQQGRWVVFLKPDQVDDTTDKPVF